MKHKLVTFIKEDGHPVGIVPDSVLAIEQLAGAFPGVGQVAGVIAAGMSIIHLLSGVAIRVPHTHNEVVEALGSKSQEALRDTTTAPNRGADGAGANSNAGKTS